MKRVVVAIALLASLSPILRGQPRPVQDIGPGRRSGINLAQPTAMGDAVYFTANNGTNGYELWRTNGSTAGTYMVKDIFTGGTFPNASPHDYVAVGNKLFFLATSNGTGIELWSSDGTAAGTAMVTDLLAGTANGAHAIHGTSGGVVYFTGSVNSFSKGLFKSDGTAAGTTLVRDFGSTDPRIANLVEFGGKLYFTGRSATSSFYNALWRTDGTTAGTVALMDMAGGADWGPVVAGGSLYFLGRPRSGPLTLSKSDGTVAGTGPVLPNFPVRWLIAAGNEVWFATGSAPSTGVGRSDGTAAGTTQISNIGANGPLTYLGNGIAVYFGISRTGKGVEPHAFNRSSAWLLSDVWPGSRSGTPLGGRGMERVGDGNLAAFTAQDPTNGYEGWLTDGTAIGTRLALNLNPGGGWSSPSEFLVHQGEVYFSAADTARGRELWTTSLRQLGGTYVDIYGQGCSGSQGVPRLTPNGSPVLGNTGFGLRLVRARAAAPVALVIGAQGWNRAIGPCYLLVRPDAYLHAMTTATGTRDWSLPIQANPSWNGAELHFQNWILDPNGAYNNVGNVSNGVRIIIGR